MIRLILVRHGQTDWNISRRYQGHTDIPLNDLGRQQAAALAQRLSRVQVDAAYSSDLSRAWETARIICEPLGIPPVSVEQLREIRLGVLEGHTLDEAQELWPKMMAAWFDDREKPPTGGEKVSEFSARVMGFLARLEEKHAGETVLVVSHGGAIQTALKSYLGLSPRQGWYFELENASLSELKLYENHPMLSKLNDTCHLNGLSQAKSG